MHNTIKRSTLLDLVQEYEMQDDHEDDEDAIEAMHDLENNPPRIINMKS
jgi:hypothetical protein